MTFQHIGKERALPSPATMFTVLSLAHKTHKLPIKLINCRFPSTFLPSFLFPFLSLSSSSSLESRRHHFLSLVSLLLLRASGASNVRKNHFQPLQWCCGDVLFRHPPSLLWFYYFDRYWRRASPLMEMCLLLIGFHAPTAKLAARAMPIASPMDCAGPH